MSAPILNIVIEKNASFAILVTVQGDNGTPINISGYTIQSQIREYPDAEIVQSFTTAITDGPNGKFNLSLTPTQTSALPSKNMVYDVLATIGSSKLRYLQGNVSVSSAVTQ
jgi:hypothetical protein